jgi:hypothetical protein
MDAPVVRTLAARPHESPGEVRTPNKTRIELVRLDGGAEQTIGAGQSYTSRPATMPGWSAMSRPSASRC